MDKKGVDKMTREEAYKAMLDRKKITHQSWCEDIYCHYDGHFKYSYGEGCLLKEEDGYEIYEESKELYQVLVESDDGEIWVSDGLYEKGKYPSKHRSVKYKKFDLTGWEE
jgi:hypothetical protein